VKPWAAAAASPPEVIRDKFDHGSLVQMIDHAAVLAGEPEQAKRAQQGAGFDESLHPRAEHGRFGFKDGGTAPARARASSIVERVAAEGGITINPVTGSEPTTGFIIGREGGRIIKDSTWSDHAAAVDSVVSFLRDNASKFDENTMLGIWHDTAHGEVALDIVDQVNDRAAAVKLGAAQNQQSIWDVTNGAEIPTGGTGGREAAAASRQATQADRGDERRELRAFAEQVVSTIQQTE